MIPLIGVPRSIAEYLEQYRELFNRKKGFETVSRCLDEVVHWGSPHPRQFAYAGEPVHRNCLARPHFIASSQG